MGHVHEALAEPCGLRKGPGGGWSLLTVLLVSTIVLGRTQPPGLCGRASGDCRDITKAGATETSSGTVQFVVTDGGKQVEDIVTQLEGYPTNNAGSVSLFITEQKQTP
jgi:hypothetical protein